MQPGTRTPAADIINSIQSRITNANRRLQVTRSGNQLTILPSQYSGLANFVLDIFINDSVTNVERWNTIVRANSITQPDLAAQEINIYG